MIVGGHSLQQRHHSVVADRAQGPDGPVAQIRIVALGEHNKTIDDRDAERCDRVRNVVRSVESPTAQCGPQHVQGLLGTELGEGVRRGGPGPLVSVVQTLGEPGGAPDGTQLPEGLACRAPNHPIRLIEQFFDVRHCLGVTEPTAEHRGVCTPGPVEAHIPECVEQGTLQVRVVEVDEAVERATPDLQVERSVVSDHRMKLRSGDRIAVPFQRQQAVQGRDPPVALGALKIVRHTVVHRVTVGSEDRAPQANRRQWKAVGRSGRTSL